MTVLYPMLDLRHLAVIGVLVYWAGWVKGYGEGRAACWHLHRRPAMRAGVRRKARPRR